MAREINVPKESITRGDLPAISPDQIVVDHTDNTRIFKFDTTSLEESLLNEGQKQPVVVRPLDDKRVKLVAGFRRHTAAMNIWKRQEKEGVPVKDRFKLQCTVQVMNPHQAMDANIIENYEREDLSPVEVAHAIHKYRTQRGWVGDEGSILIAKLFRKKKENGVWDVKWVEKTEELLSFSEPDQFLLHKWYVTAGREGMSLDAAKILSKYDDSKKEELLQAAVKAKQLKNVTPKGKSALEKKVASGKVDPEEAAKGPKLGLTPADIKEAAKKKGIPEPKSSKPVVEAGKKRSVNEILAMFDADTELAGPAQVFCAKLAEWIKGNVPDDKFDQWKRNFLTGARLGDE